MQYLNQASRDKALICNFKQDYIFKIIADQFVKRLNIEELKPNNIIEIGSRSGILTKALLQLYQSSKITICDPSDTMLGFKNNARYRMDSERILLEPYSFDLALSSLYLHRILDKKTLLPNINFLLSKGGRAIIAFPGSITLTNLKKFLIKVELGFNLPSRNHILPMISLENTVNLATSLELKNIIADSHIIEVTYNSAYELMKDLGKMGESFIGKTNILPRTILEIAKYSGRFEEKFEIIFLQWDA